MGAYRGIFDGGFDCVGNDEEIKRKNGFNTESTEEEHREPREDEARFHFMISCRFHGR